MKGLLSLSLISLTNWIPVIPEEFKKKKNSFSCRQNKPPKEAEGAESPRIPNTSFNQWRFPVGCCVPELVQQATNSDSPIEWPCHAGRIKSACALEEEIESMGLSTRF